MLKLNEIKKDYVSQNETVHALRGVSLEFGESEFAAILGPSGCGKTTLLNIIGGLDRYTEGDLVIEGKSTKTYRDRDWDSYRNHSVGFVFQTYNLIPHQTVLSNVELALTLSGVSKAERKRRAEEALRKVGLGDQLRKKPNQLSGGQMQRVAIARALVNDPEIILADEPTGALDSETSVQIMELLSEVARDRLVIMVTHNAELASAYSTRIIRLLDGLVTSDEPNVPTGAAPASSGEGDPADEAAGALAGGESKRVSMSFMTALSLSLNNLMTKKGRTILTAFAGSIGIIGIALILSLSSGFQNYIDRVQADTLSGYPVTLEEEVMDMSAMFDTEGRNERPDASYEDGYIYSNGSVSERLELLNQKMQKNDLASFKKYLETDGSYILGRTNGVQYLYDLDIFVYNAGSPYGTAQASPGVVYEKMFGKAFSGMMSFAQTEIFAEMLDNRELLDSQFDMLSGRWPEKYDELVIVADKYSQISDYDLYMLGLRDQSKLDGLMLRVVAGESVLEEQLVFSYEDLMDLDLEMLLPTDFYKKGADGLWHDRRETEGVDPILAEKGIPLRVVGIVRPKENTAATALDGTVIYTHALTELVISRVKESEIVKEQLADPQRDVFTGKRIASAAENLSVLGVCDLDVPSKIVIYPVDFAAKDAVMEMIDGYNASARERGEEEKVITYVDYIGILISSVSTIIDVITYVLIAFVAVSLVVSSIMIGVITNISVLERTKEIGVLRSIGASKRDISRVFNAETLIIGFISGVMGLGITLLLTIPVNAIIYRLGGIRNVAALPWKGALILLLISMGLTLIAGLIPSRAAAKKDPVVALRTE